MEQEQAVIITDLKVDIARNASSKFKPINVNRVRCESIKSVANNTGINPLVLNAALRNAKTIARHEVPYA